MACWAIKTAHGKLGFFFRYHGKQWRKSTEDLYDAPGIRETGEAFAERVSGGMKKPGWLEREYAHLFEGDRRFLGPVETDTRTPLLREWGEKILTELQSPLYKPEHRRTARSHFDAWIRPQLGHLRLGELTRDHMLELRAVVMRDGNEGKGATQKTARNVVTTLQAMLREAVERSVLSVNVAANLRWPQARKPKIDPFSRDEVEAVLGYVREKHPQAYAFALCLADTGMRPSEASALTWGDVDLRGAGMIIVRCSRVKGLTGSTKTAKSERDLRPISGRLLRELKTVKPLGADQSTHVFRGVRGATVRQENFQPRIWMKACRAVDVRPRTTYKLRSTFISLALSAGEIPQWVADYTGTSLKMLVEHYGRFMPQASHAPLAHIPGQTRPATPSGERVAVGSKKARKRKG